jgi:polysaccharide deacetylase 2 family uncharacterized protein YibQ
VLKKFLLLSHTDILAKLPSPVKRHTDKWAAGFNKIAAGIKSVGRNRWIFWGWFGIAYVLALCLMLLLVKIAFSGKELTELAVKSGQSVTINIASGEVTGGKLSSNNVSVPGGPATPMIAQSQVRSSEGLMPVPLASLIEQTEKGVLPITARDGTMAWKYYARPYTPVAKRPMVAIVFTNLGLNRNLTEEAFKLPHDVTMGFSPYTTELNRWAVRGRFLGFESVVDLPVQREDYPLSDPGSFGLLEDLSPDDNITRLHGVLLQYPAFVGVLASEGEKMTANKEEIKPYLVELKKRGLLFLYVKTPKNTGFEEFAKTNFFYTIGIDAVIDEEISRSSIETQLQSLIVLAKKQGYAVGLAHSYPPTFTELGLFSANLAEQGVDLVPISAIGNTLFP